MWTFKKLARAINVAIFGFYLNVTLHTLFFSCSQTTDKEGVPSKRLVNIYNFCPQIWTFLHLLSVLLRSTVSSNFFNGYYTSHAKLDKCSVNCHSRKVLFGAIFSSCVIYTKTVIFLPHFFRSMALWWSHRTFPLLMNCIVFFPGPLLPSISSFGKHNVNQRVTSIFQFPYTLTGWLSWSVFDFGVSGAAVLFWSLVECFHSRDQWACFLTKTKEKTS